MAETMTGAEIILKVLEEQGVDYIFGYPGGAILPIYDALYQHESISHILVRHEQGALHAAEGYARTSGRCGVCLVTSGPGATNAVTGLTDALLDSHPIVVISGQVSTSVIGMDAFQECDTVGITRSCTKHNYLVKDVNDLARILHEAFYVATSGRPGPVLVDIPKDIQFAIGAYQGKKNVHHKTYQPRHGASASSITEAVEMIVKAKKPVIYSGGGIVNSGGDAETLLRKLVAMTGFPITSTLMGLGAYPASGDNWLGMLGMHGTYEANMAMYECDLMLCLGARFDDRITGKVSEFSPHSKKIHLDIDPSSINKIIPVDVSLLGDAATVLAQLIKALEDDKRLKPASDFAEWWQTIGGWRKRKSLQYKKRDKEIMPQYAIERLYELTKDRETYVTTEVGQHQMWAAQHFHFEKGRSWTTSGGLGTMGYGLPATVGMQIAHPDSLVINIAGEASVLMTIQEIGTLVQYKLPAKIFIINNEYMGMVRQWQELLHDNRISESYSAALPDFVKLAEAYHCLGLRAETPDELDDKIIEMINHDGPVIFDCRVVRLANCLPMIPSGQPHYKMILPDAAEADEEIKATPDGMSMV